MGKLKFEYTEKEHCREASTISMDIPDDMDINEYKVICVRLAAAMGFQSKSIESAFGDLIYGMDKEEELKEIIKSLK